MAQMYNVFNKECFRLSDVPIYIDNVDLYLAEAYFIYSRIHDEHSSQIQELKTLASNTLSKVRKQSIENIMNATADNLSNIQAIRSILKPNITVDSMMNIRHHAKDSINSYLKDYRYLRRDWTGDERSEKQLLSIKESLTEAISNIEDKRNALFLGAGVGRIAFDIADMFEEVYATDRSFSMAWHYYKLLSEDIIFYEINRKNVSASDKQVEQIVASLSHVKDMDYDTIKKRASKIQYFVSDVLNLPLHDQSISCIFSIYFSDVIALRLWLPEIKRVLKAGGIFVHYGPLDYFFEDIREMLTCEEFRVMFEENDFVTLKDEFVETEHLATSSMTNKIYNNWLLVVKYEPRAERITKLNLEDVLKICSEVIYDIHGLISNKDDVTIANLQMPSGEVFAGAENVLDLLRFIDGEKNISTILKNLSGIYTNVNETELLDIINILIDKGLISIIA